MRNARYHIPTDYQIIEEWFIHSITYQWLPAAYVCNACTIFQQQEYSLLAERKTQDLGGEGLHIG